MAFALKHYVNIVEYVSGGSTDARLDPIDIVNQAGQTLFALHQWEFLNRPVAILSTVAGQDYVTMPDDVSDVISVEPYSRVTESVTMVSMSRINALRASILNEYLRWYAAVEFPDAVNVSTAVAGPRLAFWPTPSTTQANAFRLNYRAGWRDLVGLSDIPVTPVWMEPMLTECVRLVARAMINPQGSVDNELAPMINGPRFLMAKRRDGSTQMNLGVSTGGILQSENTEYRPFDEIVSPAP